MKIKLTIFTALLTLVAVALPTASWAQITLGSATNAFTLLTPNTHSLAADNATKTVAFIHRNNTAVFGGVSGNYRYDMSANGGNTWTTDQGVLNPTANTTTLGGRYPQCALYNTPGNTAPANAYMAYMGSIINNSVTPASWDGYFVGAAQMNNSAATFNSTTFVPNSGNTFVAKSMVRANATTYWAVDIADDTINTNILVYKGVWNTTNHNLTWTLNNTITPNYDRNNRFQFFNTNG